MQSLKIRKIGASQFHVEEHFQFIADFIREAKKAGIPVLIPELFAELERLYAMEDEVLETIRKSQLTGKIEAVDQERETLFSGMRDIVKGMQSHINPQIKEAAMNLMFVFNAYKNVNRKNYAEQTGLLTNFIQEMRGNYAQYVTTLGLGAMVNQLDERNQTCSDLLMERTIKESEKPKFTATEMRSKVDACYGDIVRYLEAKTIMESDHKLETFFDIINSNVDRYKRAIAQRAGVAAAKKAKNEKVD
jgi:hypothetical protein